MAEYNIAVMAGDGIGPEVTAEAVKVLEAVGKKFNHKFNFTHLLAGGCAIDEYGESLPSATLEACKKADIALLGAVGGPKWDNVAGDKRPEKALLNLRSELKLYANYRPATMHKALASSCPLKDEITGGALDIMILRELTGGIYFGERGRKQGPYGETAYDIEQYGEQEVRRIAHNAFKAAMQRRKRLTSVDKANVLESSRLWRSVINDVAKEYPDVEVDHMYVDNAAMQLVRNPRHFDVIVTNNIFGDILSDEASMITGSIGLLPSASLGETSFGMYEPVHGSAPDIAGQNKANPIAAILSAAMALKYSFKLDEEAAAIENAVTKALNDGLRTPDIMSEGMKAVGSKEMGDFIAANI